jgi:superoxide dismutase, Fe-Mn family
MQRKMQRRTFIRSAGLVAGTALAVSITQISALAEATSNAGRRPMSYDIKPLSFDPKNIKGLSEKLLVSHYENNYSGAVKRLNALTAQLAELDFAKTPVFVINGLKREESKFHDPSRAVFRWSGRGWNTERFPGRRPHTRFREYLPLASRVCSDG